MELKPCPFCGSEDVYPTSKRQSGTWVKCRDCLATGPSKGSFNDKMEESDKDGIRSVAQEKAIEEWNNRPQKQKLIEALEEIAELMETLGQGEYGPMDKQIKKIAQQALDEVEDT